LRVPIIASVLALTLGACGGNGGGDTIATEAGDPSTTEAAGETTMPTETTALPDTTTPVGSTTTVATAEGSIPDPVAGATLVGDPTTDITAGDVFVYWYRDAGSGKYLAVYTGPGITGSSGQQLCPGNSIAAPDFMYVSNTPIEDGSCEGFPTEAASVQVCSGDVWLYQTAIPGDVEGTLYGSLEWSADDGSIQGKYSQFPTSTEIGEFEYGLGSYDLWDGFTSDGSSTITCDKPLP
jgi:hypothetical protein